MNKRVLFLDFFSSLVQFLTPYSKNKLKYLSKALSKRLQLKDDCLDGLTLAAKAGQLISVYFFLKKRTNFDWPLTCAAENGYFGICEKMIELGAGAYAWALALENASFAGHIKICKILLKSEDPPKGSAYSDAINNSIAYAAYSNHLSICKLLIGVGANIQMALQYARDEKTKEFLIAAAESK